MRVIKSILVLLCALFLAGHATAGSPGKNYSVAFSGAINGAGNVVVSAKFTNLAPPGSGASQISSASVSLGAGNPLKIFSGSSPTGVPAIISNDGSTASFYGLGPILGGQSATVTVTVSSCGEVLWDSAANTGTQLNGQPLTRDPGSTLGTSIACGTLACNPNPTAVQVPVFTALGQPLTDETSPQFVEILRGPYNSNGVCSTGLNFFVTNQLPAKARVHWPMNDDNGLHAVFAYTMNLPSNARPDVAWIDIGGLPSPFPVQDCTTTQLPAPYGVLNAKLTANKNQFNLDSTGFGSPPALQSYIVIDTEWMQVTDVQGNQVTVSRTNSLVNPAVVHAKGAFVMSTPAQPILTTVGPYSAGTLGLICMAGPPTGPNANGTYTFTFIDIGDGTILPR
jgi:hypothetical protein